MASGNTPVLSVTGLVKSYRSAGEEVAVLRGVNPVLGGVALTGDPAAAGRSASDRGS
jgi:putative ABC transport system ATP-binding protein